jgi:hypothetical protein
MASEYCKCVTWAFKNDSPDQEQINKCAELAEQHKQKLAEDAEANKIYAEDIVNCAMYGKTSIDR